MESTKHPAKQTQQLSCGEFSFEILSLILHRYIRKGLLTNDLKPDPHLNSQQKSMLAHDIAKRYELRKFCPFFENYWGLKNLSHNNYKYTRGSECVEFAKLLREIK